MTYYPRMQFSFMHLDDSHVYCIDSGTTIELVFNSGPGARRSLGQDSRAPGPLVNTKPIVHPICQFLRRLYQVAGKRVRATSIVSSAASMPPFGCSIFTHCKLGIKLVPSLSYRRHAEIVVTQISSQLAAAMISTFMLLKGSNCPSSLC